MTALILPRNLSEVGDFFSSLTPGDWNNARLGGITVLGLLVGVSVLAYVVLRVTEGRR